jgi:hypothetical protein
MVELSPRDAITLEVADFRKEGRWWVFRNHPLSGVGRPADRPLTSLPIRNTA